MGRAHGTRRCAKRICCRSGNGGFAACSGRKSTGTFFSLHIFSSIQAFFFYFCVSTSGLNTTRPTFFSFWKRGGRLLPYSCSEKRPGYVAKTPRGRYFGIILWNATGGVYSVLYGMYIPRIHLQGHHGMFTMSVLYHHTSSPPTVQHAH